MAVINSGDAGSPEQQGVPRSAGADRPPAVARPLGAPTLYLGIISTALGVVVASPGWGKPLFVPGVGTSAMAFPLVVGVAFVIVGLLLVVRALLGVDPGSPIPRPERSGGLRVLGLLLLIVLYVPVLESLGFVLANALLCLTVIRLLGRYRWWVVVLLAAGCAVGMSLVFETLLRVELPKGMIDLPLIGGG